MIFNRKKSILFLIFLAIILGSVVFYSRVFSYKGAITHPALTDNAAKIYNASFDRKLSDKEIGWLKQGSADEDKAPRWMNHFYEPRTGQGLWGFLTSKAWAQNSLAQGASDIIKAGGDQTWQKAISAFAKGDGRAAFYALGHVLHLLEDAAVPAHTRLDSHINGDPYESWVADNIGMDINFSALPIKIDNLNQVFDSLAGYSNKYFLSKDTIKIPQFVTEEIVNKKIFLMIVDNFGNRYKIVEKIDINGKYSYIISDFIHSDYFSLLAPKAISYSAGVIDLFFREAETARQKEQQKSWWQKLKEKANDILSDIPAVNLMAGIGAGGQEAPNSASLAGGGDEAPEDSADNSLVSETGAPSFSLPPNTVAAEEIPPAAPLPGNVVSAQEKTDSNSSIIENIIPSGLEIPPPITEETTPANAVLPIPSPSPNPLQNPFIPGVAGPPPSSSPSDIAPPNISNIASSAHRSSADISWASDESGAFQIEYGTSASYGLLSAATALNSLTLSSLSPATDYHFRILAQDNSGNATSTADQTFTTSAQADSVIISEIQVGGAVAKDEFVELYNPTNAAIDLTGWKLARRTQTATSSYSENLLTSFPSSSIPAHGYFLIAHPTAYDGGVPADAVYSSVNYYIAPNNAVILYSDNGHTIVDLVGLGAAASYQGTAATGPPDNQSLERKTSAVSLASTLVNGAEQWSGNGYDSDNNSNDFVVQANSNPQNSLMLTEPRDSVPNLMTASSWPTWQKDMRRTGLATANSLATSTMAIKWTATTTAIQEFISRPTLDSDGNIYIGRKNGLVKYSSAGALSWLYPIVGTGIAPAPLIVADNTIYFRGDGGLYAINSSGQLKWAYALSGVVGANAAIAILSDGAIITQSAEKIYAINQDATLKWVFDSGRLLQMVNNISALAVDAADNVYVAIDDYVYGISSAGVKIWEKNPGLYYNLTLGTDQTLYFGMASTTAITTGSGFFALNTNDGSTRRADTEGYNNRSELAPAIDAAGNTYRIFFKGGGVKRIRSYAAGTSTATWTSSAVYSISLATPILTADHKIYLADQQSIRVIDAQTGEYLGAWNEPDNLYVNNYFGAIGADGTIYTANSTKLYAIGN